VSAVWYHVNHWLGVLPEPAHNCEFTTRCPYVTRTSGWMFAITFGYSGLADVSRISSPAWETDLSRSKDWIISLIPVTNDSISVSPLDCGFIDLQIVRLNWIFPWRRSTRANINLCEESSNQQESYRECAVLSFRMTHWCSKN